MSPFKAWLLFVTAAVVAVVGLFATLAWGAFPADFYNHQQKSAAVCTTAADCAPAPVAEVLCENSVCKYADDKMDNVAQYVEDMGRDLLADNPVTNMPGVIEPTEIDSSLDLAGLLTDETGASGGGQAVFANTPTINSPIIPAIAAGSLPSPGTPNRLFVVTSAATCTTAGTSTFLCRDTGSAFEIVGPISVLADITQVGNCMSGACLEGTSGTEVIFRGTTSGTIRITAPATAGTNVLTLPANTGTLCSTGQVCLGYATSSHTHTTIGDNVLVNGVHLTDANFIDAASVLVWTRTIGPPDVITADYAANSVTLGADTIGTLPLAEGGLGFAPTDIDRGGLLAGTSPATLGILPLGLDGRVPVADASAAQGIRWAGMPPMCTEIEDLIDTDDRRQLGVFSTNVNVILIGCHCRGTCTTPAVLNFHDSTTSANVIGSVTCSANNAASMATVDTSASAFTLLPALRRIEVSVTNTPVLNSTDDYLACAWVEL